MLKVIIIAVIAVTVGFVVGYFISPVKWVNRDLVIRMPVSAEEIRNISDKIIEANNFDEAISGNEPLQMLNFGGVRFDFVDPVTGRYAFESLLPEDLREVIEDTEGTDCEFIGELYSKFPVSYVCVQLGRGFADEVIHCADMVKSEFLGGEDN